MRKIRVSGAQIPVTYNVGANKTAIIRSIKKAKAVKADFLITPEGSLSGFHNKFNQESVDKALKEVVSFSVSSRISLLLGTCFNGKNGNKKVCYNQIRVYTEKGKYLGFYAKQILCTNIEKPGTGEMSIFSPGTSKVFKHKGIVFGTLICNDLWVNPRCTTLPDIHLTQILKKMGAKVIFHAVNSGNGMECLPFHDSNLKIRAKASRIPIVTVNATKGKTKLNSYSGVVGADGEWLVKARNIGEKFFYCDTNV